MLTDFLSRRDERLLLADKIDLQALVDRYGTPLEVSYCPLISEQIARMHHWAAAARARTGYAGAFLYAYATKANFAEEVVRTAMSAGAHYETSSATDLSIAHELWQQGLLPDDRLILCNGSKEPAYIQAIVELREAGYARLVPILDDLGELEELIARCRLPLLFGVRERHTSAAGCLPHSGSARFGLTAAEIAEVADRLHGTPHRLVVYHAMVGSQIEDAEAWLAQLAQSATAYCQLRARVPTLQAFNFGGGMPTSAYALDFHFDYGGMLERLMHILRDISAAYGVPPPDLIGEFGRYTVASHSLYLFDVGAIKDGQTEGEPIWCLLNGSLMVALPDSLIVEDQQFIILPLDRWAAPVRAARLAGRATCDSDDVFPPLARPALLLPSPATGMVVAVFGVGAYQQMIAGRGGVHHCLSPEMRRIIIERDEDGAADAGLGALVIREVAPQSRDTIMAALGYPREALDPPERQAVAGSTALEALASRRRAFTSTH
jgi:arginine decarboxylase